MIGTGRALKLDNVNLDGTLLNGFAPTNATTGLTFMDGDVFYLVIGASSISGQFANQSTQQFKTGFNSIAFDGQLFAISYEANAATGSFTGGSDIALMAIPEPQTFAMILGGFGMLIFSQRLRRRSR